ncbi:uncharacterized protein LOC134372696 [Cynocephalus volans]|uniref:uncharacterized protein LOC134372696 n=1 Tax=Cynocephalus volans TaxID=110931 RepID=UPI002FCA82C0
MLSVTCSVLVILIFSRSNGDSVTQTGPVTVSEGAPVILNCTYQTTYSISVLLWYVQYLNKAPQLLLKSSTENQRTEGQGFQANHVKSDSFFYLKKPSAQMSDSAVYYCALIDTVRGAAGGAEHKPRRAQVRPEWVSSKQEVSQNPEALNVHEGENLVLNCSYTDSAIYFLQWFRQDAGKALTSLLLIQSSQTEQTSGRIKASLDKSSRHSTLYIGTSQPGDSATYLCAVRHSAQQTPAANTQTLQLKRQPHVLH